MLPPNAAAIGLSLTEVGVLLAANRVLRLLLNEPAGEIVARIGPRGPLVVALALAVATTFSYGHVAHVFALFVVARVVWGLAWSLIRHASNVAVLEAAAARRGELLGSFRSLSRVGSLVAVLLGSWLVEKLGFARAYDALAVLTVPGVAVAALAFARRRPVPRMPRATKPTDANAPALRPDLPGFVFVTAGSALAHATGSSLLLSTASLAVRELAGTRTEATVLGLALGIGTLGGVATAGRWVAEIGAGPIAGSLVDRVGGRPIVALAGLSSAAALFACARAGDPVTFALAAIAAFVALALLIAALDALAAHGAAAAGMRGTIWLGRYFSASDAASAVGPFFGPALATSVGLARLHGIGAGAALAVALAALFLGRRASERMRPSGGAS